MTTAAPAFTLPILFDRPRRARENRHRRGFSILSSRDLTDTRVEEENDRNGIEEAQPQVSIFNILPFRSKPKLDLDSLYRQHASMVARRVRQFIHASDVEEVVHEVFLKAHERRDSFRGDASPVTWLYHIATNHCLNRLRNRQRRERSLNLNKELPWLRPSSAADAEQVLLIEQLWAQLDEEQSLIAMYYFVDGLTHSEIARITGVSRRTIGNRIDEIQTFLRSRLEGQK